MQDNPKCTFDAYLYYSRKDHGPKDQEAVPQEGPAEGEAEPVASPAESGREAGASLLREPELHAESGFEHQDPAYRLIITPLIRALVRLPLESLVDMLDGTRIQWTLSRRGRGDYYAAIYANGAVKYQAAEIHRGRHGESAKAVLARCAAAFFVGEKRDFHDFLTEEGRGW